MVSVWPALLPTGVRAQEPEPPTVLFDPTPERTGLEFLPRVGISTFTGPGVGYTTSFSTLEGFLPFNPAGTHILFFGDLHGILNNSAVTAANLGGGTRYYLPEWNRILGGNVYFDNRQTGLATFNQVGFGFETLGRLVDVRSNAYFVVVNDDQLVATSFGPATTALVNPTFSGYNLLLDQIQTQSRTRLFQGAMSGFDLEVGGPMPLVPNWLRGYVGTYNFQGGGNPQAWGARGRLEAPISQYLSMNLALEHDRVFGTTIVFGGAINFPGIRSRRRNYDEVRARLADPVVRNYNVVVEDHAQTDTVTTNLGNVPATNRRRASPSPSST
jgi:hypothetical protein